MNDIRSYLLSLSEFRKAYKELQELAFGFWEEVRELSLVDEFSCVCCSSGGDPIFVELDSVFSLVLVDDDCMAIVSNVDDIA